MANTRRKNVVLTESSEVRIQSIKEKAELSTDAEAIRAALTLYEEIMTAQINGYVFRVETPDGTVVNWWKRLYEPLAVDMEYTPPQTL